ncbi:MAG: ribose-phosphate pyrophosphokinase [Dehalococcoidales bacterium]|nr:ribose-phosphate pyrophosphokinase [Dehalococcoidales bacterium]
MNDELKVFSGNAHPKLAKAIADSLHIPLGKCEVKPFSNENTFVRVLENVRERDVFIVQPISSPVNSNIMELLIMIDAMKRASARRITAVMPYYAYGRSDKKDQPRVPITARLIADLLTVAGANRVLTLDLHKAQIQGFFNIPVDELTAFELLTDYFKKHKKNIIKNLVVIATDFGITKQARDVAAWLGTSLAIMEKRRVDNNDNTELLNVIGDVKGKNALIVDEEIDTAGSLVKVIDALKAKGAKEVYAFSTHAVFSNDAVKKIDDSVLEKLYVTNSLPSAEKKSAKKKIEVISIAPLLGETIKRIHTGKSVGALFAKQ